MNGCEREEVYLRLPRHEPCFVAILFLLYQPAGPLVDPPGIFVNNTRYNRYEVTVYSMKKATQTNVDERALPTKSS